MSPEPFDLTGRRVLVTGASSGLGAAMARGFAEQGAIVGICARRAERLAEVLADVQEYSPQSRSWNVDLAELDGIEDFASRVVDELGGVDMLVNNAGIPKRRWAWQHRDDEIAAVLRLNVESPIRLTLALLDVLGANIGHVVFVGSVAARLAPPGEAVYAASKAAITAFAESLRVDLGVAGSPIGVHVIQPGVIDTELFGAADNDESIADIDALEPAAILEPLLDAIATGRFETFVPGWFAEIVPIKMADPDGFLAGSIEYAGRRLVELGRTIPSAPGSSR